MYSSNSTYIRKEFNFNPNLFFSGLSARQLGGVIKIQWISRKDLSFQNVQHLYNPWNDKKPVKIGRDGQEIEPSESPSSSKPLNGVIIISRVD